MTKEEIKKQANIIAGNARKLADYATTSAIVPEQVGKVASADMLVLARLVTAQVQALDYLIQGNPPPKTGDSPDSGVSKIIATHV